MPDLREEVYELIQAWEDLKGGLEQIGSLFEGEFDDEIAFISETLSAFQDEMTAIPDDLRNAAEVWGEAGTASDLTNAAAHMQGGYAPLDNVWQGASADAAELMHRAMLHAMDSTYVTLADSYRGEASDRDYSATDVHIEYWGESQRGKYMAQILTDTADELDQGFLEHLGGIWGAISSAATIIGVATIATGGLFSIVVAIVGAVATLIVFAQSVYESLAELFAQTAKLGAGASGGMDSDQPNYGPWALSGN